MSITQSRLSLPELLSAQAGVVARWQLLPDELRLCRREVEVRRWRRIARCYVDQNGRPTDEQRQWLAVLNAGTTAALAGRSAAGAAGLVGWGDGLTHVLIRRGTSNPPALDGVKIHWTRSDIAVHPVALPARVRIAPALLQASAWMTSARAALGVLAAGVQQRLVRPEDLRRQVGAFPEMKRRALVLLTLDDIAGGAHALSEIDAAWLCRRAGLPLPSRQAIRVDRDGRRRYLDLDWHEWRLTAEIDGRQHMEVRRWCDDMLRQNELVIAGSNTLRFPSLVVRTQPATFTDQIRRGLMARGWRP